MIYGLPMSFNEIFASAIVGSGYAAGRRSVSQSKMAYTALAWMASLTLGFALSYGGHLVLTAFLG